MDKAGLRKKPIGVTASKGKSKYSETDLIKMNSDAGDQYMERLMREGKLTAEEQADIIRKKLKKNG